MLSRAVQETAVALWCALPPIIEAQNAIRAQQAAQKEAFDAAVAAATEAGEAPPAAPEPIPFLTDAQCTAMKVSVDEVKSVFLRLHRASFSNALLEDSEAAVGQMFIVEGSFASFRRLVRHYLLKEWADRRCVSAAAVSPDRSLGIMTSASSSRPGTSNENVFINAGAASSPPTGAAAKAKTVVEAYLYDIVQCVVDDREPCGLLPYENVWVRSFFPKVIEHPFRKFAKFAPHPTHDAVFDAIYDEMLRCDNATISSTSSSSSAVTLEAFTLFFTICYKSLFRNAALERCVKAAEDIFYRGVGDNTRDGKMDKKAFVSTCDIISSAYGKTKDTVGFIKGIFTEKVLNQIPSSAVSSWLKEAAAKAKPAPYATLLEDPEAIYIRDELCDELFEASVLTSVTKNRILVTGPEGVGKSTVAKEIADKLNIVNLDVEALAVKAADNPSCPLGSMVRRLVANNEPIPLYLQAELLNRALREPATQHLGYVCGDIVPMVGPTTRRGETSYQTEELYLAQIGFEALQPRCVVRVSCPKSLLEARRTAARQANQLLYAEELALRDEEQAALDAVTSKAEERKARAERNEALRRRKTEIQKNASDEEPTEEELAILNTEEEEEPEEPPQVDEEGNELSHEEVAEREAAKLKAVTRRRFLAELHHQILAGRAPYSGGAEYVDPIDTKTLALAKSIVSARNALITIGVADTAEKYCDFVTARLGLAPSVAPSRPQLSEEALEGLGPEAQTAEYYEALGQANEAMLEESAGKYPLSDWGRNCPVTYADEGGILVEGAADFLLEYRGFVYFFASLAKAKRFTANPHPFLAQKPLSNAPVLLLKSKIDAFTVGPDPKKELIKGFGTPQRPSTAAVEAAIAEGLGLTPTPIADYMAERKRQAEEIAKRTEVHFKRTKDDAKARKETDDRLKKRAEAEALRKKKEERNAKGKKAAPSATTTSSSSKKAAAAAAAAAAETVATTAEDEDAVEVYDEGEVVLEGDEPEDARLFPTESRIFATIKHQRLIVSHAFAPQLISLLDDKFDATLLKALFESRQMPQNVIIFDKKVPPPPPTGEDGDDEPEHVDSDEELDQAEAEVEAEEPPVDEDGNPLPVPEKVEDLTDLKQYRRFVRAFVEKLEASKESAEDDGGLAALTATGVAAAAPEAEGATPTPKPHQSFTIIRCNAFNKPTEAVAGEVLYQLIPSLRKAAPFEGELAEEDEPPQPEDGESPPPSNPLLWPGPHVAHQFGFYRKYCPVSFVKEGALVTGSTEFVVSYKEKRYLFASEEKMNAFLTYPEGFMRYEMPPRCPPPRFWLLGTKKSGRSTVMAEIGEKFNVPVFADFDIKYFEELIAAATKSPSGADVRGLHIPFQQNAALDEALLIQSQLKAFDEKQAELQKKKEEAAKAQEEREREIEEGEEVDEIDEEEQDAIDNALAFEPEEEEAKAERLGIASRAMGAALTRIEPFATRGYILVNHPATEADLEGLLAAGGAHPDAVINTRITAETYVSRFVDELLKERLAAHAAEVKVIKKKREAKKTKERELALKRWRRRNIGGDDNEEEGDEAGAAEAEEEEEEIPEEDPEAPTEEQVRAELEQNYETEIAAITPILDLVPEKRIPVVTLTSDDTVNFLKHQTHTKLRAFLADRSALLEAPMVLKYKAAKSLLAHGQKNASYFGERVDAVELYHERYDPPGTRIDRFLTKKPKDMRQFATEPETVSPSAAAHGNGNDNGSPFSNPKKVFKQVMRTVVRQNEAGEDEEVEEMEEVEEEEEEDENKDDDEEQHAPEEEEEELDLEPEPELEAEELAEMEREHKAALERAREKLYPKAAAFRNRIYFFKTEANLLEFMECPFRFWNQPPPLAYVRSVTNVTEDISGYESAASAVAAKAAEGTAASTASAAEGSKKKAAADEPIVPPSPVRPLAYHLALSTGAAFITVPKLLSWALLNRLSFPEPFASQLNATLLHGEPLSPAFVTTLLAARLQCADALGPDGAIVSNVLTAPADYTRLLEEFPYGEDVAVTTALALGPTMDPVTYMIEHRLKIAHHIPTESPTSAASLVACNGKIKAARKAQQVLELRRHLGFPAAVRDTLVTEAEVAARATASYKLYCPFTWSRRGELVEVGSDRSFTAEYLGQFYAFSQQDFLDEFLVHPDRFDKAAAAVVLPKVLPRRLAEAEGSQKPLEYYGCCPVVLYDTRDDVGLCGVASPTAVKGSLFVEYDNKFFAVSSEERMQRFLRQPWVFVEHPVLPPAHKLPHDPAEVRRAVGNEKYIGITLHDPIARAMVEVAKVRPKYPGMSAAESARKFVALYLRANNPANTPFAAKQHAENYEDFKLKATLYKTITSTAPQGAADEDRFALWDAVQENPLDYLKYATLRTTHTDPEATAAACAGGASKSSSGKTAVKK